MAQYHRAHIEQTGTRRRWIFLIAILLIGIAAATGFGAAAVMRPDIPPLRTAAPTFTPAPSTPVTAIAPVSESAIAESANGSAAETNQISAESESTFENTGPNSVGESAKAAIANNTDANTIENATVQSATNTTTAEIDAAELDVAEQRIIDVYERVAPSVVSITSHVLRRTFFFEAVPEEGAGSGFILDTEGHILTNYHVIRDAQQIEVNFGDDIVLPGGIVGVDARNDIAVLQVDAPSELLAPVELGESNDLRVGQRAIAIGNPFGHFGRTLTTGVISALDRTLEGQDGRTITGVINNDAAINRGNSGGPLLDSTGRVIGINSAIFSPTGTNAGVGFAVPIDTIHRLLPDLLALGRYRHPWLGIRYSYAITPGLAEILKLPVSQGLLLVQLYDGAPLAQAEVQGARSEAVIGNQRVYTGGDILVAVDGTTISRLDNLETLLEDNYRVGDTVTVTLVRDNEEFSVEMTLAEEPN